jgi:hypothetical protein
MFKDLNDKLKNAFVEKCRFCRKILTQQNPWTQCNHCRGGAGKCCVIEIEGVYGKRCMLCNEKKAIAESRILAPAPPPPSRLG